MRSFQESDDDGGVAEDPEGADGHHVDGGRDVDGLRDVRRLGVAPVERVDAAGTRTGVAHVEGRSNGQLVFATWRSIRY